MELLGINWSYLFIQLMLIGALLFLTVRALLQLRQQEFPETARAIWAALFLNVPIGGAGAVWIVKPGKRFPGGKDRA